MGFGLLFFGFTLVLSMTAYSVLPSFIGYFLCMYACLKLSSYEKKFRVSAWIFGIVGTLFMLFSFFSLSVMISKNTILSDSQEYLQPVSELVFYVGQIGILPSLASIARDTGRTRTAFACKRNIVLYVVMFALFIASNILVSKGWEYSRYCVLYATVSRLVVILMTMIQVFSCYMWICREGEEEAEKEEAESKLNRRVTRHFDKKAEESAETEEEPKWIKDKKRKKRK